VLFITDSARMMLGRSDSRHSRDQEVWLLRGHSEISQIIQPGVNL